jgi:hypothetical protein
LDFLGTLYPDNVFVIIADDSFPLSGLFKSAAIQSSSADILIIVCHLDLGFLYSRNVRAWPLATLYRPVLPHGHCGLCGIHYGNNIFLCTAGIDIDSAQIFAAAVLVFIHIDNLLVIDIKKVFRGKTVRHPCLFLRQGFNRLQTD